MWNRPSALPGRKILFMARLVFEELFPMFKIEGDAIVYDGETPFKGKYHILKEGQKYWVKFRWTQLGDMCYALAGKWKVNLFFEEMGYKEEVVQPEAILDFKMEPDIVNEVQLEVDTNALGSGIYKVVGRILFENPFGVPMPIAAFGDLGMIEIYTAKFPKP